jgi:hypothetical protein
VYAGDKLFPGGVLCITFLLWVIDEMCGNNEEDVKSMLSSSCCSFVRDSNVCWDQCLLRLRGQSD